MKDAFEMTPSEKLDVIITLRDKMQDNFLMIGEVLSVINREQLYKAKGYPTFKALVETEYGLRSSTAHKLATIWEFYVEEQGEDEHEMTQIGQDKLFMILTIMKKVKFEEQEEWLENAKKPIAELQELVNQWKKKEEKKTIKELVIDQYLAKMTAFFNCSTKELNFKLALYFQDIDLDDMRILIRERQRTFEEEMQKQNEQQPSISAEIENAPIPHFVCAECKDPTKEYTKEQGKSVEGRFVCDSCIEELQLIPDKDQPSLDG